MTDVSTALPESDYDEGTIVTVTMSDPNAVITRIVLHGFQDVPELASDVQAFQPSFIYSSGATQAA